MTDAFTKILRLKAIDSKSAAEVAMAIWTDWMANLWHSPNNYVGQWERICQQIAVVNLEALASGTAHNHPLPPSMQPNARTPKQGTGTLFALCSARRRKINHRMGILPSGVNVVTQHGGKCSNQAVPLHHNVRVQPQVAPLARPVKSSDAGGLRPAASRGKMSFMAGWIVGSRQEKRHMMLMSGIRTGKSAPSPPCDSHSRLAKPSGLAFKSANDGKQEVRG